MEETQITLGDLVGCFLEEFLNLFQDEELAMDATVATIREFLVEPCEIN